MATKSVLKSSASALLALLLGTAALIPATASAQERVDRGERGAGRMERYDPAPSQAQGQSQAPRPPVMNAPSGWQGRPQVMNTPSFPRTEAPRPPVMNAPTGWQGRTASQDGGGDRERGDRGNGAYPNGQPTFGRPAWATNGGQPPQTGTPSWGSRNPTYVDPARGRPATESNDRWNQNRGDPNRDGQQGWRGNNGQPGWQGNNGQPGWQGNRDNNWQRGGDRERDRTAPYLGHDDRWASDNNRDGDRDGRWRGNNRWQSNNNGWRGNSWGYNNGGRSWDRDGWRRDNRYNWYGWRNRHRSTFSLGFYSAPWRDYSYSRLSIGVVIGAPFYSQRYWIADPWAYRLPPADGPYRWVRYYDDALLVDIYSGEVVDVIYDIFY